jgi:hypothetical protein
VSSDNSLPPKTQAHQGLAGPDLSTHTPMMQQCGALGRGVQTAGTYAESYAG